ncbi:hypothetical protein MVEG_10488 [Podila verticillata NRRL 6337]|nr:hypothetical protein MVEG_10488 [Podila verticillata NRRL 6337]
MENNTELQDLIVSYYGHDIHYRIEHIVRMGHTSSRPLRLNLLDRMNDTCGRAVAQLAVGGCDREDLSNDTTDLHGCDIRSPFFSQKVVHKLTDIVFTQWDCDHLFSKISDYSALFLDIASRQHPSVLTLLTLDVSCLSRNGLSSIQEVLHRSDLQHLHVVCTPVDCQFESIAQVLGAVQWSTLKSLVLAGHHIEAWIDLCQPSFSPSLLSLQIQGTLPKIQELSHSNVLFIIQLICASPVVELCFQNVQLQERRDWELIVESMDVFLLQTLSFGEHDFMQLLSVPDAIALLGSRSEAAALDTDGPKIFLAPFTLDFATLSRSSLESLKRIFSYCCLEKLIVKCDDPIDLSVFDPIASVLDSVPWLTLKHLYLSEDSVSYWIRLLINVNALRLKSLNLRGAHLVRQELTHSSMLFVERLMDTNPLVVHLEDIQLQDPHDWVLLVEKMHSSMENLQLGGSSLEQLMSTPEAANLKHLKLAQWLSEQLERVQERVKSVYMKRTMIEECE